jgi:dolichyl-phosphate beta-glucosyltransferase
MQETTIVIPCFNEANRLPVDTLASYLDGHPRVRFVLVDDGSTDHTHCVLEALATARPAAVTVLRLARNSGKAEAVRRGMLLALDDGADLVGYWDADLATPLRFIDVFVEQLSSSDAVLVFGSRVRLLGSRVSRRPVRHYVGRVFATIAGIALSLPIYDTQCGAKLFRASAGLRAIFEKPFELGWTFDVELFARLSGLVHQGKRIDPERQLVEWPLDEWRDAPGSKLGPAHFSRVGWELGKLFFVVRGRSRIG